MHQCRAPRAARARRGRWRCCPIVAKYKVWVRDDSANITIVPNGSVPGPAAPGQPLHSMPGAVARVAWAALRRREGCRPLSQHQQGGTSMRSQSAVTLHAPGAGSRHLSGGPARSCRRRRGRIPTRG
jgi:hypothetical protein